MNKEKKSEIINYLSSEFKDSQAVVICSYNEITHKELENLRHEAKENNTKVQVAKNTLVQVAVKNADLGSIELSGNNIFLWSKDQISACKVADKFANLQKNKFEITSGIIEGKIASLETVNKFAKLASKEELIGMLLSVWTAPARYFVCGLDNLREQKENKVA